jgi:aminopeptidase N
LFFSLIFLFSFAVEAAQKDIISPISPGFPRPDKQMFGPQSLEDELLNSTFRIDIQRISVTYEYYPNGAFVNCTAVVEFFMRPGQTRPLIHLDPAIRDNQIVSRVNLNGEELDFQDESDVRVISFDGTNQQAIEFQRSMPDDPLNLNTLVIHYGLSLSALYPRFSSEVSDLEGRGNEERFPCINAPHELAEHVITFRVYSQTPYRCIGSGLVVEQETVSGAQEWVLWTEQEVASYSVMFALMPEADTRYREQVIDGVDVRLMAFNGGASIDEAVRILETWLPDLRNNLGPFPMPRGFSVFLVSRGGGMEYYGGTISTLNALDHELIHMYFGCSTVNKTYRDSWLDEAIDKWYENTAFSTYSPIAEGYSSNMVSGRSPIAIGFDRRAYQAGSRIIEAVARELGGRQQMMGFLSYLHQNYSFQPFTTMEFLVYLLEYGGVEMTGRFLGWLYQGEGSPAPASSTRKAAAHPAHNEPPDMTPPGHILEKYLNRQKRRSSK